MERSLRLRNKPICLGCLLVWSQIALGESESQDPPTESKAAFVFQRTAPTPMMSLHIKV